MSVASPAYPVAYTDPIEFAFEARKSVKGQVRFYSDLAGLVPIAKGSGSRDVAVSTADFVVELASGYTETALDSDYAGGTTACTGGTWYEFTFADGSIRASFACSGGADPVGALSYRVILSIGKLTT